jgi:hypothetical protein
MASVIKVDSIQTDTGNIAFSTVASERLRIDNNGNVGIGTTSPSYKLDVQANNAVQAWLGFKNTNAAGAGGFYLGNDSFSDVAGFGALGSTATVFGGTNSGFAGTWRAYPFVLFTNNTERMRIDSSGVVSLNTPSGTSRFEVLNITDSNNQGVRLQGSNDITIQHLSATSNTLNFQQYYSSAWRTAAQITGNSTADFKFDSGYGSAATAYGCRAWCKFNGTGTIAINGSGNVSSLTDNGVGDYSVNFTTAMPDANFSGVGTATYIAGGAVRYRTLSGYGWSTGSYRVVTGYNDTVGADHDTVCVAVFR